jgi:hypothetical protein
MAAKTPKKSKELTKSVDFTLHPEDPEESRIKPARDERGYFVKGNSGNPGGRKLGVAEMCRRMAGGDGSEILELWREIYLDPKTKSADRLMASKLFSERMWGKALEVTAIANLGGEERAQLESVASDALLQFIKAVDSTKDAPVLQRVDEPHPLPVSTSDAPRLGAQLGDQTETTTEAIVIIEPQSDL